MYETYYFGPGTKEKTQQDLNQTKIKIQSES